MILPFAVLAPEVEHGGANGRLEWYSASEVKKACLEAEVSRPFVDSRLLVIEGVKVQRKASRPFGGTEGARMVERPNQQLEVQGVKEQLPQDCPALVSGGE